MAALRRLPVLLPCLLTALTACEIREDESPTISIVAPEDGGENNSSSVQVVVDVGRFTLDPTVYPYDDDRHSKPFRGHWHLYLDRLFIDDQFTTEALITGVGPGVHEIAAELVNQNHTRIHGTPPAFASIEVPSGAPSLVIREPGDGDTIRSSSVQLALDLENFLLDPDLGGPSVPGHGHLHVTRQGVPGVQEAVATSITVTDLAPTTSALDEYPVLQVELVENDHSALATPVVDFARLKIPGTSPRVSIGTPLDGASVGSALTLTLETSASFSLVDFTAVIAETDGQGHYHVLVDGADVGHGWQSPSIAFPLAPGPHEVRLELRSNLHDPLSPPVVDVISVVAE